MLFANLHLHNASHWPSQHFALLFDSILGHFFRPILLNSLIYESIVVLFVFIYTILLRFCIINVVIILEE